MKKMIFLFVAVLSFATCSSDDTGNDTGEVKELDQKEILSKKIEALESRVYDKDSAPIPSDMQELMLTYQEYGNQYKEDENSPTYYFKAGELAYGMGKYDHSIDLFTKVVGTYEDFELNPTALFYVALVYHYQKKDIEAAKTVYERIIQFYPESQEAKDSAASINLLGKSDEEIIKEFQQKNSPS